nr:response regulator transcription factor [Phosphitispora fastidiosa]
MINSQEDMAVIGEVGDGKEVVHAVVSLKPDVLLLDLSFPGCDGIEVIKELRARGQQTCILILTMHEEETYLKKAIEAGAHGYIVKKATDTTLISSIKEVARGGRVIDPVMAGALLSRVWSPEPVFHQNSSLKLSERETEVLRLIALGYSNLEIAEELVISSKTVESHKASIRSKLGVQKRSELVRYAMGNKII